VRRGVRGKKKEEEEEEDLITARKGRGAEETEGRRAREEGPTPRRRDGR